MASFRISRAGRQLFSSGKCRPFAASLLSRSSTSHLPQRIPRPTLITSIGLPRYASTAAPSVAEATASKTPLASAGLAPSEVPLDAPIPTIEPHIGYLHELGLDYGWGPSSIVQWLVEHLQVVGEIPMWGAVVGSVLVTRLVLLPFFFQASDVQARMAVMGPVFKPLREKAFAAQRAGDSATQTAAMKELRDLNKKAGIKMRDAFIPMLLQAPLGFGLFRFSRGMAELPLPELQATTLGWLTDLTVADPYCLLPALTSGIIYMTLKAGGEQGEAQGANPKMQMYLRRGIPALSFVFTIWIPAITQIGFFAGAVWALIQAHLLKSQAIRAVLKLHPLPGKGANVLQPPKNAGTSYAGTITRDTTARVKEETAKPSGWEAVKGKVMDSTKTIRDMAKEREKKHERLTSTELKNAETYEARKKRIEREETLDEKARESELRRRRLARKQ